MLNEPEPALMSEPPPATKPLDDDERLSVLPTVRILPKPMLTVPSVPLLTAMLVNVLPPESVWAFVPTLENDVPVRLPANVALLPLLLPVLPVVATGAVVDGPVG